MTNHARYLSFPTWKAGPGPEKPTMRPQACVLHVVALS